MKKNYTHVLWDWNGTLLDDAAWCVRVMNAMLAKRGMKTLDDLDAYRAVFGFPVQAYYQRIGFDFAREPFSAIAAEYIAAYHADDTGGCTLHEHVMDTLQTLRAKGIEQVVLSASRLDLLQGQMRALGVTHLFDEVFGLSDIYARSKAELGRDYIARHPAARAVLIGDTTHDYETAQALGIDCLLIAKGHQNKDALRACNVPVFQDIVEVIDVFE